MKFTRFMVTVLTATLLLCVPVAAAPGDNLDADYLDMVVSDLDEIHRRVQYYQGVYRADPEDFTWVTGRNGGTALELNGSNQSVRLTPVQAAALDSFTFSTWIYWYGNRSEDGADGQPLLTMYRNENYYLQVFLHKQDEAQSLDGIYMIWTTPDMEPITLFTPVMENTSFAFPENQWHHVAVTASDSAFTLYIDGVRYLHADIDVDLEGMNLRNFRIGAGYGTEPCLHACLQNAVLYTSVLSDNQVALLAQDKDPLSDDTAVTTTGTLATRPTTVLLHTPHAETEDTVSGRTMGLIVILSAIVLLVVTLSIVFSVQESRRRRNGGEVR